MRNGVLALSVGIGSKVFIGDGWYRVIEIKGDKVRIAHKFPQETRIERQAVRERRIKAIEEAAGETH